MIEEVRGLVSRRRCQGLLVTRNMSTQTGIRANGELMAFFAKAKQEETKFRLIKVAIRDEQMALEEAEETGGSWESDWERLVVRGVDQGEPCYLLYRVDDKWLLICWSPDTASVRNKMLYASTKATLKKDFGSGHIFDDLYANSLDDITLSGYRRHMASDKAPQPLTREEEERAEVKKTETSGEISVETKHQTVAGLSFPLTKAAVRAVTEFRTGDADYVQLSIDVDKEVVELTKSVDKLNVNDLANAVPKDKPRYHLFRYDHSFEGTDLKSNLFIYSMPGYECSIKERMLYSSCRNALVDQIAARHNLAFDKKMEVDGDGDELTEDNLLAELHPKKVAEEAAKPFSKPKPPSRGKRRITRVPPPT